MPPRHKYTLLFLFFSRLLTAAASIGYTLTIKTQLATYKDKSADPDFYVKFYDEKRSSNGTVLFADTHILGRPRIIEVNMKGELIWEYILPMWQKDHFSPGIDVELLSNENILYLLPYKGIYEINRAGRLIWLYEDKKVSHDVDRLPNGNTLIVWGANDSPFDAQVKEVNPDGKIVWSWEADKHFDQKFFERMKIPEDKRLQQYEPLAWTNANAAIRLINGDTLINLRTLSLTIKVNHKGDVLWSYHWGYVGEDPYDPQLLPNGNVLIAVSSPYGWDKVVEMEPKTGHIVWEFFKNGVKVIRNCQKLPNGNVQLVSSNKIIEVTPDFDIVWMLGVKDVKTKKADIDKFFYKAIRIPPTGPSSD